MEPETFTTTPNGTTTAAAESAAEAPAKPKRKYTRRGEPSLGEALARTYNVVKAGEKTYKLNIPAALGRLMVGKAFKYELTEEGIKLIPITEPAGVELPSWAKQ